MDNDEIYIRRAIGIAKEGGRKEKCSPIGSVIVLDDQVIGEGFNEVELRCDPSAHAEIVAMRRAGERTQNSRFKGATLYSTLQPCGMCTMASIWGGISRIVYGAERHQVHKMYFEDRDFDTIDFVRNAYRDDLTISGGVLSEICATLYYGPEDHPPEHEQANK